MPDFINTDSRNPGPAVLGHDPVIAPEQREAVKEAVESTGAVDFPDRPVLPWLENPNR